MDHAPAHAWQVLHPPLQPWARGWLDVGDGHRVFWEQSGHPGAPAALFLHGGPGAGCAEADRRWFDPTRWRIVLLDQRGCGRSTPAGAVHANTTAHLVADIEALREHLGVTRWGMVFGGSWGSTLALAYAQRHRQRAGGLVLRGVFTATHAERDWLFGSTGMAGAALVSPGAWLALRAAAVPGLPVLDGLAEALDHANGARRHAAALAWWRWEQSLMAHEVDDGARAPLQATADSAQDASTTPCQAELVAQARIGVHYARHGWFLPEGQLLADAGALAGLRGSIVQGGRDRVTPPRAARALQQAWPGVSLLEIAGAGHASSHPAMASALVRATESFIDLAPQQDQNMA